MLPFFVLLSLLWNMSVIRTYTSRLFRTLPQTHSRGAVAPARSWRLLNSLTLFLSVDSLGHSIFFNDDQMLSIDSTCTLYIPFISPTFLWRLRRKNNSWDEVWYVANF
ncbi:hypothetical protein ACMD2_07273 [Ananas comosus]|uniref:Secreted protein n=1 Tax=Ananas comosus TaxID=4615 RepID=A0A199VL72_ANACO|nr:hypothetical protein ACMD2_07273 [Ananas comosus]